MEEAQRDREQLVREAHESAARIGERVQAIADELSSLVTDLRRTSDELHADPAVREALALPAPDESSGTELAVSDDGTSGIVDAIVVEDEEPAQAAEDGSVPYMDADEAAARLQGMSDEELAEAYSSATREVRRHARAPEDAGRYMNLIEAIVHEALTRPAFTEDEPPRKRFRRPGSSRRRRRRAVILADLRNACRDAREPAEGPEPAEAGEPAETAKA
jgi:hypothetical protein